MVHISKNIKQKLNGIITLRDGLIEFIHQAIIEEHTPELTRPQALHIQPAFDSHIWRNSPLFRKAKKIKPFEVDFLAAILQRLDIKKEFDEEAHDKREAIGYTWGMLALFALESDTVFMKHLTLGAFWEK